MTHQEKIKTICLTLGFPQEIVDCLLLKNLYPPNIYTDFAEDIVDINGISIGKLRIGRGTENPIYITFSFFKPQDFIRKVTLTHYNKDIYTFCCINFDNNFEFLNFSVMDYIEIITTQLAYSYDIDIWFSFDIRLNIQELYVTGYTDCGSNKIFEIQRDARDLLPIEDELLLIEFSRYKYNTEIVNYLPEFYVPSAYDFNSYDFQSRIILSKIINI